MLPSYPQTPKVSQTTMGTNLLQPLQIIAQFRVDTVGKDLRVLSINDVLLSVQEPCRDLELSRALDNRHKALQLVRVEFTSPDTKSDGC